MGNIPFVLLFQGFREWRLLGLLDTRTVVTVFEDIGSGDFVVSVVTVTNVDFLDVSTIW